MKNNHWHWCALGIACETITKVNWRSSISLVCGLYAGAQCLGNRFSAKFAPQIGKKRMGQHSNWQWHLDKNFIKIDGERFYLRRAVDHEGKVLEYYVAMLRKKFAAKSFSIKEWETSDHPRLFQQISWHPMASPFVRIALLINNFLVANPTTDVIIRICRFDGENERCNVLKQQARFRFL